MDQHGRTGHARRALGKRQVIEQHVIQTGKAARRVIEAKQHFLTRRVQLETAVALYGNFRSTSHRIMAAIPGNVVPHGLNSLFRKWKWNAAIGIDKTVAAADQSGFLRIAAGVVVDPLRRRSGTSRGVYRHPVAVRVGFEHRHLPWRQTRAIVLHIGVGDGEQGLVSGIRVDMPGARPLVSGRRSGDSARPGRDGPRGITCHLASQRGQTTPERRGIDCLAGVDRKQQHQRAAQP